MSKLRESIISNCEEQFLNKCLLEFTRLDGRSFDEYRELKIEFSKEWGCCYVSLGKTRVLAQVSCEIQQPKSSRPSEGLLNVNIELTPMAAPHFEAGRQSDLGVQLNRLLEKCIKDSKAVDLESLCIKSSEKVWALRVDVNVLNHEGNILDCASISALAALAHFRRPDVTIDGDEIVIHTYAQRDPIPTVVHHYPVCISYAIFSEGNFVLADPDLLEENTADAHLAVALNAYKELCGLHLGGKAFMTPDNILQCTARAARRVTLVVELIQNALEKDKTDRLNNQKSSFESSIQFDSKLLDQDLSVCLDRCVVVKPKKKKNKKKNKQVEEDMEIEVVESLDHDSAELTAINNGTGEKSWKVSSDNESEKEIAKPTKKKKRKSWKQKVAIKKRPNSESEEEKVVILGS